MVDLYSISGSIEPTRLSWTYRAGLVVVAIAMLALLPAVVDRAISVRADVTGRRCAVALQVEAAIDRHGVAHASPRA